MSGIAYPYFPPVSGNEHRWTARLRRDNPDLENGKAKRKYVCPYGDHRHLFFPPGAAALLADIHVPLIFVEAEKSALALRSWADRVGKKYLPVAMGGCYGWKARIGKVETASGERVDEYGPISDLGV